MKPSTAVLLCVTSLALIVAWCGNRRGNAEHLQRLNVEAQTDTTTRFYRGQLQVASRLVVQGQVHLASALRIQGHPVASVGIALAAETVYVADTSDAGDTFDIKVDTMGLHVRERIVHKAPEWWWAMMLARDSLHLNVVLSCEGDGAARATVSGPRYQPITLTDLKQDARICNPPPRWNAFSLKPPSLPWIAGIATVVLLLTHH